MSNTSSTDRIPARPAQSELEATPGDRESSWCLAGPKQLSYLLLTGAVLLTIVSAGTVLRLYRLDVLPPALIPDEGAHGLDALAVLQGQHAVYFPAMNGREGMIVYLIALATSLFGRTILAVRLPTALASTATIVMVFWLGKLLFDREEGTGKPTPWRGLFIGSVGAGLMTISLSQIYLGRIAYRSNLLPLFLSLCLAFLWLGWHRRNWIQVAVAGLVAGLLPYTYTAARIAPLLFLLFGLSFLRPFGPIAWKDLRSQLPVAALFIGLAALLATPILVYAFQHPDTFFLRSSALWIFHQVRGWDDALAALWGSLVDYVQPFGMRGNLYWNRYYVDKSILSPYEAAFMGAGVILAIWRWNRSPALRLLLLWLVTMAIPIVLSKNVASDYFADQVRRLNGAAPAVFLLTAFGSWELLQFMQAKLFPRRRTAVTLAAVIVAGSMILAQGILSYRIYFNQWADVSYLDSRFGAVWLDLASTLNELPSDADDIYLVPSPYPQWRFPLKYLFRGEAPIRLIDTASPDLAPKAKDHLAQHGDVSTARIVEWKTDNYWIGDDLENLNFLFAKYGRFANRHEFPNFRVHEYTDINLDRPWTFYDQLEPLPIQYDGGIALTGFALGQGDAQLPSELPMLLAQGEPLWGFLQWRLGSPLDVDFALSLRLYNGEGHRVYQADNLIWKLSNHTPTSYWAENEVVDSLFRLDLPSEFLPGSYDLRLVVYDFKTQIPTVETGVWEPEATLATLHLSFPAGR